MTNSQPSNLERLPSGINGLDQILCGGFLKGGLYIIEGEPGAGKTVFGNQLAFNHAKTGSSGLYITLIAETVGRMLLNLRDMTFYDERLVGSGVTYLSAFSTLKQNGLSGVLNLLRREVSARRASLLLIDGFATVADVAASQEDLKFFIQQLQTQADAAECTVFLMANPNLHQPSAEETMVEGIISFGSQFHEWRAARELAVRKFRGSPYLQGVHSYEISNRGITVYPRLESIVADQTDSDGRVRVPSGIHRLDEMMSGGFSTGSITMVIGPSGTGKTTLGLNFLAGASGEEPGLLFGFYESPARVRAKASQICPALVKALDSGAVEIMWQAPAEHVLDALATRLLDEVRRRHVRRLLIDGLLGFDKALHLRPIEPFFSALVRELRNNGVTTICTAEAPEIIGPTITTRLSGLSDVTDNHILLRFVEVGASLHRMLSILKLRDSEFDHRVRLFSIGPNGIELDLNPRSADALLSNAPQAKPQEVKSEN
jgi:circadian clock protein KaiC